MLWQVVEAELFVVLSHLKVLTLHELLPARLLRPPLLLCLPLLADELQIGLLGLAQDAIDLLIMLCGDAALSRVVGGVEEKPLDGWGECRWHIGDVLLLVLGPEESHIVVSEPFVNA